MPKLENKDLRSVAPRSAYDRIGGFAILARTLDKCRAAIAGQNGEYHFDCPLDNVLFSFKGIKGDDFKAYVAEGHHDEEVATWLEAQGTPRTEAEITAWSDAFKTDFSYSTDPNKKDWFFGECKRLDLDPMKTTLFDFLEADDKASF